MTNKFQDDVTAAEAAIKEMIEAIETQYPNVAVTGCAIQKIDVRHMGSTGPEFLTLVKLSFDSLDELE